MKLNKSKSLRKTVCVLETPQVEPWASSSKQVCWASHRWPETLSLTLRQSEGVKRAVGPPVGPTVTAQGMATWAVGSESAPGLMTSGPSAVRAEWPPGGSRESLSPAPGAEETWASGPHAGLVPTPHTWRAGPASCGALPSGCTDSTLFACTDSLCPSWRTSCSCPISPQGAGPTVFSLVRSRNTKPRDLFVLIRNTICIPAFPQ